ADILDVGAESTRPYGDAIAVTAEEELSRLEPVLPAVIELGVPVSIDTMKARVARAAIDAGAAIVNDVWGLQRDPDMVCVVASRKRFIDRISPAPPTQRLGGSIASHVLAVARGAAIVRTHDVAETVQALRVAAAIGAAR